MSMLWSLPEVRPVASRNIVMVADDGSTGFDIPFTDFLSNMI